jgi:hypothetical protein
LPSLPWPRGTAGHLVSFAHHLVRPMVPNRPFLLILPWIGERLLSKKMMKSELPRQYHVSEAEECDRAAAASCHEENTSCRHH